MPNNRYLDAFAVLDPGLLSSVRLPFSSNPANHYGFPRPDDHFSSPAAATTKHYFADETKWRAILEYGDFDDIVVGTGFSALAYIDKALELDRKRRILVLERGGLWLMTHFQNLSLPFDLLLNNASESYPWALTSSTFHSDIKFVRGSFPLFGGRSTFCSAWSPRPPLGSMRDFPKSLRATAGEEQFWQDCRDLLNVVEADQLFGEKCQALQRYIGEQLDKAVSTDIAEKLIDTARYLEPASLSVGKATARSKLTFEKFSTPGPLLKLYERQRKLTKEGKGSPLTIVTDVVVERFEMDPLDPGKRTSVLHTSRGALSFSFPKKPNIILAMGAIPACTIVLNSVRKQHGRAGSRLSGKFLCHINARFPLPEAFRALRRMEWDEPKHKVDKIACQSLDDAIEMAAYYLVGRDPSTGLQYHGEITVIHTPLAEEQYEDAARLCPDFFSAPTEVQLEGSQNHVVVACCMHGEIDETNPECRIRLARERNSQTTNIDLQLVLSENDKKLREVMYKAALQAIHAMAGSERSGIEYWHDDGHGTGTWDTSDPERAHFQVHGAVNETSTLYMDDTLPLHPDLEPERERESSRPSQPSVDRNYRVYGTGNVYVTGSAIFPTSGSWNPTLTACGFAQDLATKLHHRFVFRQILFLSITLDQVNRITGSTENLLGALRRRIFDTLACLNPKGLPLGQKGMWQLSWGPAIWTNDTDTNTTGPDLSWYVAYYDNLEFEDGSLHPTYVIAVAGILANAVHKMVDFTAYVSDGQFETQPTEVSTDALDANKVYLAMPIARAVHTLLTNPAPSVSGVMTLLDFINTVKSTKDATTRMFPRFIFTGHGVGAAIAPSVALSLVAGRVLSANRTLTYSTAGPTPGNASFANLFERTLRARGTNGAEGYSFWNINLVNTLDVVPHAWCHQRAASPNQHLGSIPAIYGTPIVAEVMRTTDTLISRASDSGVVFKPLPSRYFTSIIPPSAPPASLDEFLRVAVRQHVEAYVCEVGTTLPEQGLLRDGCVLKAETDVRLNYPVIHDLERARTGEAGTSTHGNGAVRNGSGTWRGAGAAFGSTGSTGGWFGTRTRGDGTRSESDAGGGIDIKNGNKTETNTNAFSAESKANSGTAGQKRTWMWGVTGMGTGAGAGTHGRTGSTSETGSGKVTVTPSSALTVLKYGHPEYQLIPQSVQNHPLLVYRSCFPDPTTISAPNVTSHLLSIGVVEPHRTGTLLIRDHFYTAAHRVLCVTAGQAQLRFGGEANPGGVDVEVVKGEVVIVPAGVPHRLLKDVGRDLEMVEGFYPKGAHADTSDARRLGSRLQQTHLYSVASLGWFTRDPIYGDQGPVMGC